MKDEKEEVTLKGRRVVSVVLSDYPNDPRPRRAAEALVQKGMKVEVICATRNPGDSRRMNLNGVDVVRLPIRHQRAGKLAYAIQYSGFLTASLLLLAARCLTRRYALVHVHNMPDILAFCALVPKMMGAKVVLDLHDPMPELMRTIYGIPEQSRPVRFLKFLEKVSIGFCDDVITVNKTCKKMFAARSCSEEKISVIMNSPDENMFALKSPQRPSGSVDSESPFVVMYHGSLVERNGLSLAVEAVALVAENHPEVELQIYGHRTPFLENILEGAAERGLEGAVRYMGARKIEEIVSAIDSCDIGIVPNLRNIFTEINTPTRIFEFLARGKPVIAPSSDGVLEYFDKDELITFELGNAADLAERIEFSIENPDAVFEITCRGHEVCNTHCWAREKVELTDQISRILSPRLSKAELNKEPNLPRESV